MDTIVDIQAATPEIAVIEIAETDSSEEKERERVEARRSPRLTRTVHDMNSLQYPHGHWLIIIQRRDAYRKASGCRLHPTDPIEMILKIDCKVSDRGTGPQAVSSQASTTGIIRTHCSSFQGSVQFCTGKRSQVTSSKLGQWAREPHLQVLIGPVSPCLTPE
ncbi:hypothetical protein ASPSYDRAFT_676937 [Aspergillus sydowii CBS 593.65]|uniref:Uncharacterized protein n=1 Tax=Aspergillus sydowii CBS 593.65 TaxID=1036612 RepID=A0A1L9TU88_9EURO|nr:uncharacterized protein ASPSYDRAFT_676937 [Aspergillus sydowii CBS 593.65]OJJ62935.1 hypothetical protein ASPSYDRAFT_676937 [Aspergillus sydowii CBS 593.65]